MKRTKALIPLLLLLAVACASTGTGDPAVVKAEDALTNGLTSYATVMNFHFANSTKESPDVYKVLERFRTDFPVAWKALDDAKRSYQANRAAGVGTLEARLTALSELIAGAMPLVTGGR